MYYLFLFLSLCTFSTYLFAATPDQAPATMPTESAKPLPTLKDTGNLDTVIGEKVQEKITRTPALKNQAVSASSREQVVTLEGSVETKQQEQVAIKVAKSVKGVKEVKSQLTIKK